MKKITSIILAALMLCAICAPAFAKDEPTEVKPEERGDRKVIYITDAGNYIIKGDYSVNDIGAGSHFTTDVTLTIPKGVTVTVTDDFNNFGTINVCGTLIISDSAGNANNFGTINIMGCCGGKFEGTVNNIMSGTVNTYNEHSFGNGKCIHCGVHQCETNGVSYDWVNGVCSVCHVKGCEIGALDHNWVNGVCSVCGTKGCEIGQLKHNWVNGVCSVCGTKGCEIGELKHNWVNGVCSACNVKGCVIGQLKHNWVSGVCSVCDKHCEHKWDANTSKCTVCEYECRHNDGYTAGKCNICQQECKHGNTFTKTFCSDCGEEVKNTTPAIGSALSEGNMIIIVGIACLAVGALGMYLIMRKKKKA